MTVTEEDIRRMEEIMRAAKEALERQKQENAILVKMLVEEKTKHEALKSWVRGFQS